MYLVRTDCGTIVTSIEKIGKTLKGRKLSAAKARRGKERRKTLFLRNKKKIRGARISRQDYKTVVGETGRRYDKPFGRCYLDLARIFLKTAKRLQIR